MKPTRTLYALLLALCSKAPLAWAAAPPSQGLVAFRDEADLKAWLATFQKKRQDAQRSASVTAGIALAPAPAASPAPSQPAKALESVTVTGSRVEAADSVTNVQTAGVDEGGIVKTHGDHLVILRRGRLFTVSLKDRLRPVAHADAFGPGLAGGAWIDEMLIHGDTLIVIGFSYARGGTEIGLFDIGRDGRIAYRDTYHLRSNDYYSSRNYASRLVDGKLVFYAPLMLGYAADPWSQLPALRRWGRGTGAGTPAPFKPIAPATRIYRSGDEIAPHELTLHSVTTCDLSQRDMSCESTGVLAPSGRVFYVSATSVYVWTGSRGSRRSAPGAASALFRMPLDGAAPTGIRTSGGQPIDQFSFLEDAGGHLNVFLQGFARGDGMWSAEFGEPGGAAHLLRVPLSAFSARMDPAPDTAFRRLPAANGGAVQNRFVGDYLLYGTGNTWWRAEARLAHALHAVRYAANDPAQTIALPHGVDRIEAMGTHAVVIGTAGKDLLFSSVALQREASIPFRFTQPDAAQGETR
ncbi:MAG: beta-propeller domain-containing protein, partial [Betaproteobacteria bacterium]|nr:beta-propeller domain-containing protein [Betaproteobacteria bacterium]